MLPATPPPARRPSTTRGGVRRSTAITAGFALFLVIVGLISSGLSGGLIMAALFAFVTGVYTLVTNRPSWARLNGRRAGAITAAAAVVAMLVGGAIAPASDSAPTAVAEQTTPAAAEEPSERPTAAPTASVTPSATPSPRATPTATPSPAPTDIAPLDADTVVEAGGAPVAPSDQPAPDTTALALLETLPVKGRAPKTGYSRELFGQAWLDVDRNGCDTRNDMLNRDLTDIVHTNSVPCKVQSGTLADPYTGTTIAFQRGQATSTDVQIDHVVALSDAWQKGAQQLSADQRVAFANDPLNLQATDGPTNQQKGAGDAATWLPPNTGYRCEYVARQVSVKATYALWVTQAEHDAMVRVLSDCKGILAPTNRVAPSVTPPPEPALSPEPAPVVVPIAPAPGAFANCSEAAAAGLSNIPVGSPAYSPDQDGDGDGVACEGGTPDPVAPAPVPVAPAPVAPAPVAPAPVAPAPAPVYANCSEVRAAGAAPIYAGTPGFQSKFDGDGDGIGCDS